MLVFTLQGIAWRTWWAKRLLCLEAEAGIITGTFLLWVQGLRSKWLERLDEEDPDPHCVIWMHLKSSAKFRRESRGKTEWKKQETERG